MRLIEKQAVSDSIMYYDYITKATKIQGNYYNEQFKNTFDYSIKVFDFTLAKNPLRENFKFKNEFDFKNVNLQFLTTNISEIKTYSEQLTMMQLISGYYILFLKNSMEGDSRLITLLKKEDDL
ncbi:MAG: hypothetical protein NVSMB67_20860 [Flavisolibacter sp.]